MEGGTRAAATAARGLTITRMDQDMARAEQGNSTPEGRGKGDLFASASSLAWEIVVSVSGGKDSTATYCRAVERGLPFRAVAADTGNEHPATYEAIANLSKLTGGPEVEMVKADFSHHMARKRAFIEAKWEEHGVPRDLVERALAVLHPTGNPYLDLCLWKGRFPSRKAQFCTQELKIEPIDKHITRPLLATGRTVISWQGVRASESFERSLLPPLQRLWSHDDLPGKFYVYRPILRWTTEEVFAYAARFGVPPNPLYGWGCSRVGCFPCINASKAEIALVDRFFPEQIERLVEWEKLVSEASKRGQSSFFAAVNDPVMANKIHYEEQLRGEMPDGSFYAAGGFGVRDMVKWAKTDRGGRQFNLFYAPEGTTCASHGACE